MPPTPRHRRTRIPALSNGDLENLRAAGLSDETIRDNKLCTKDGALVFLYHDIHGKANGFSRIRPHVPRVIDGKLVKYIQPKGSALRGYFPAASLMKLRDGESPIFITEGEKKALALSQLNEATIGLGGVWCGCKKGADDLIGDLAAIDWSARDVYIVFDYDAKVETRHQVDLARRRLAKALRNAGAGRIYSVSLPPGPDGKKQGVDDYLVANGKQAFRELLKQAVEVDEGRNTSIDLISLTPPTLGEAAYHGFMGEFIRAVAPYTEATDAGILAHLICATGTMIGPGAYVWSGDKQPARFNTALVGPTSTGRKGTSLVPVKLLMQKVNNAFWGEQCVSGLSSGERLIQKVSDERTRDKDGNWEVTHVEKRLYVVEFEFSKVLMQTRREGNILSQILRESYDSGDLSVLTRSPLHANNAHICVTGHITPEELKQRLSEVEMANGFGNRFLWFVVKSDKELPCAAPISDKLIAKFSKQFADILRFAAHQKRIKMDADAIKLWKTAYSDLRRDRPGFAGSLTARGESIVLRLSLLYTLLDKSAAICSEHIEAAFAVWRYNVESVQMLFGNKSGSSIADDIYRLLGNGPMKTSEFYGHIAATAEKIHAALADLQASNRVRETTLDSGTRGPKAKLWERV